MRDASTMSKNPARSATRAMMSSGAFPNVAEAADGVAGAWASCSVERTIQAAMGTMASAAAKKTAAGAPPCSRASATGTNARSHVTDGLSQFAARRGSGKGVSAMAGRSVAQRPGPAPLHCPV